MLLTEGHKASDYQRYKTMDIIYKRKRQRAMEDSDKETEIKIFLLRGPIIACRNSLSRIKAVFKEVGTVDES
jgi:hypothetical protein